MDDTHVIWDLDDDENGNVQHLLEHFVTKEEAEDVLLCQTNSVVASRSSENLITFGYTRRGRYLGVVWMHILHDPLTIYPVTAFDAQEPQSAFPRKRKN